MLHDDPTGLPALAVLALGLLAFTVAVLVARSRRERGAEEGDAARGRTSAIGIGVQALAFLIASFGPQQVTLDPLSATALLQAGLVAALMLGATGLFVGASRAMGRNWSLRARTRTDHALVTSGPFALVRHPIYLAILLFLIALAVAFGHPRRLLLAIPVYAVGTGIRVREEEALLRAMFGTAYDTYAARVKRFVPGLF